MELKDLLDLGSTGILAVGIAALWNELRSNRKEMREDSNKRTDEFIALTKESITSRGQVGEVLNKLVDRVEDIPCSAASRFNSGAGR